MGCNAHAIKNAFQNEMRQRGKGKYPAKDSKYLYSIRLGYCNPSDMKPVRQILPLWLSGAHERYPDENIPLPTSVNIQGNMKNVKKIPFLTEKQKRATFGVALFEIAISFRSDSSGLCHSRLRFLYCPGRNKCS